MKKKYLLPAAVLLAVLCVAVLILFGGTYTVRLEGDRISVSIPADEDLITVELEGEEPVVALLERHAENDTLSMKFHALKKGKTMVTVVFADAPVALFRLYVHASGVITYDSWFGDSTADVVIPLSAILFVLLALWAVIRAYRANLRRSMYQYGNVMSVGLILYLSFLLLNLLPQLFSYHGLQDSADKILYTAHFFSILVLPVAFLLSVLITISNVTLMRKEGRNWRNLLGTILGVGLCLLTIAPVALDTYLQWSPDAIVDVHNESGLWLYIETFVESFVSALVTYLECILVGTVLFGFKAARHVPAPDKDYILILGCQIAGDGSLTPLLRSRVDRAVTFANKQKETTGKDLIFVPSGGQGADEVMPEAEAMKNYLLSLGIPEERILAETASANTYENVLNSMKLIREKAVGAAPKVAFSTTNYHVFRAGLIAHEQGESLEGVGSPTKRYFWINAFIREFAATMVSERKKHVLILLCLTFLILLMVVIKYLSVIL